MNKRSGQLDNPTKKVDLILGVNYCPIMALSPLFFI